MIYISTELFHTNINKNKIIFYTALDSLLNISLYKFIEIFLLYYILLYIKQSYLFDNNDNKYSNIVDKIQLTEKIQNWIKNKINFNLFLGLISFVFILFISKYLLISQSTNKSTKLNKYYNNLEIPNKYLNINEFKEFLQSKSYKSFYEITDKYKYIFTQIYLLIIFNIINYFNESENLNKLIFLGLSFVFYTLKIYLFNDILKENFNIINNDLQNQSFKINYLNIIKDTYIKFFERFQKSNINENNVFNINYTSDEYFNKIKLIKYLTLGIMIMLYLYKQIKFDLMFIFIFYIFLKISLRYFALLF